MNITPGFDKAAAYDGGIERLPAGGYICNILKAWVETTMNGSEQIALALEIAEGNFSGFFGKQFNARKANDPKAKWTCVFKQFTLGTDGQTNPFFKGMLKSIEESNVGYKWNWNEATLANKKIGMIFREEEFEANDGTIKTTVRPWVARSVQRIRDGVEVPEIRRLNNRSQQSTQNQGFSELPADEMEKLPWE